MSSPTGRFVPTGGPTGSVSHDTLWEQLAGGGEGETVRLEELKVLHVVLNLWTTQRIKDYRYSNIPWLRPAAPFVVTNC